MAFSKGESGNPSGRPKGATNKSTRIISERLKSIIEDNMDGLDEDLKKMNSTERVKAITALMQYVLPKQQSVNLASQIELEYKALQVLLEGASDEAITAVAAKMIELKAKGGEACEC